VNGRIESDCFSHTLESPESRIVMNGGKLSAYATNSHEIAHFMLLGGSKKQ
jgi:hypothetical protein